MQQDANEKEVEREVGEPRLVGTRVKRQNVVEIPSKEIHTKILPGKTIVEERVDDRPHVVVKENFMPEDRFTPEGGTLCMRPRIVKKKIVKEIEQIIELPRQVEEIVYVDQPIFDIVEIPEYHPVVVSRKVRSDCTSNKCAPQIQWVPEIVYDATKDPAWAKKPCTH